MDMQTKKQGYIKIFSPSPLQAVGEEIKKGKREEEGKGKRVKGRL